MLCTPISVIHACSPFIHNHMLLNLVYLIFSLDMEIFKYFFFVIK